MTDTAELKPFYCWPKNRKDLGQWVRAVSLQSAKVIYAMHRCTSVGRVQASSWK